MSNMAASYMENLLVDSLDRLRREPEGRKMVHMHLSELQPSNRSDVRIKIVTRMFKNLESGMQAQLFPLNNMDLIIVLRPSVHRDVNTIVHRIRTLFDKDPLTYVEGQDGADRFVTWFDLDVDMGKALAVAQGMRARAQQAPIVDRDESGPADMSPGHLDVIQRNLARTDVGPYIREQAVIRLNPKNAKDVAIEFSEYFLSVGQLQQLIAPDVNVFADKWLFQDLSRIMDIRMLDRLMRTPKIREVPTLSLNLNIRTVLNPVFVNFAESLHKQQKIIVEIQVIDVLANLTEFLEIKPAIRDMGHALLIDGLSPSMLEMLDIASLDPDFAKILWSPELVDMMDPNSDTSAAYLINHIGRDRMVLSRCDTQHAMAWGLKSGITRFQGHFFDALSRPKRPQPKTAPKRPKLTPEQMKQVMARRKAAGRA